jgi:hypothetical protein
MSVFGLGMLGSRFADEKTLSESARDFKCRAAALEYLSNGRLFCEPATC